MRDTVYLTMDRGGVRKMTKSPPYLEPSQVAIKVEVRVDDRHFAVPFVSATLSVEGDHLIHPEAEVEILDPELQAP